MHTSLPTWHDVDAKRDFGDELDPLERMVFEDEPAGENDEVWRERLWALVEFIRKGG